MSQSPWHWPSFLAGWFAGLEREHALDDLSAEGFEQETAEAKQEWEKANAEYDAEHTPRVYAPVGEVLWRRDG